MEDCASILSILESLSGSSDLSQRKIAAMTGLNVAKVNFLIHKLVEKGFVNLRRVRDNPRRRLYLLTPAGVAQKSMLTYRLLLRTLQLYREAEQKVVDCVESMVASGSGRIVLLGNTEITDLVLRLFEKKEDCVEVMGVVDPTGRHPRTIRHSQIRSKEVIAILCDPELDNLPCGTKVWRFG